MYDPLGHVSVYVYETQPLEVEICHRCEGVSESLKLGLILRSGYL